MSHSRVALALTSTLAAVAGRWMVVLTRRPPPSTPGTESRTKEVMPMVEYHVDVIEISEAAGKIDVDALLRHLRGAGSDGWELVSAGFDIDLERFGRSHLLLFKRFQERAE